MVAAAAAGCGRHRPPVLVVGGGLAGLAVLDGLAAAGREARLLEAGDRLGGRVYTLREGLAPGLRAEAGAERIPGSHVKVRSLAARLGCELIGYPPPRGDFVFRLDGGFARFSDPSELPEALTRGLTPEERACWPHRLHHLHTREAPDVAPGDPRTGLQWLHDLGLSERGEAFVRAFAILDPAAVSAAGFQDMVQRERQDRTYETVAGGVDRLTRELARRHRSRIRKGVPVTVVHQDGDGVKLHDARGGLHAGSHVVLALPIRPLLELGFQPHPPRLLQAFARSRQVEEEIKVHAQLPVSSLKERGMSQYVMGLRFPRVTWRLPETSEEGLCILNAMAVREDLPEVRAARRQGPGALEELLRKGLPELPGLEVPIAGHDFNTDPLIKGTFTYRPAKAPLPPEEVRAGRVVLAGSDVSDLPGWMEGALRSAERAVKEVMGS